MAGSIYFVQDDIQILDSRPCGAFSSAAIAHGSALLGLLFRDQGMVLCIGPVLAACSTTTTALSIARRLY